jgi:signal transduction histidine kinase
MPKDLQGAEHVATRPVPGAASPAQAAHGTRLPTAARRRGALAGGDDEVQEILVRRLAGGLRVSLACSALFLAADAYLYPGQLAAIAPPKLALVAALLVALRLLRRRPGPAATRALAVAVAGVAYVTIAVASATLREPGRAPVVFVVIAMATGSLPWGVLAHASSLVIAWLALGLEVALLAAADVPLAPLVYPAAAFAVGSVFSLYAGFELMRFLRERRRAQEALVARRQAEQDALVASDLERVGRALHSSLATDEILERLCAVAAEVLVADACLVAFRRGDDAWRAHVTAGSAAGAEGAGPRLAALAADAAARLAARVESEDVVAVRGLEASELVPPDLAGDRAAGGALLVALRADRGRPAGVLVAIDERPRPATAARCLVAQGLGRIASIALANARVLEQVERTSRMKSELVSTMSHELRTPLNVILGNAEMLDDGVGDAAERRACVAGIRRAGRELLALVDNTLEIGTIEARRFAVHREAVAAGELWRELRESCSELPLHPAVELAWAALEATDEDEAVAVDRGKVAIVVREIRVADTGIGIAPEHQAAIFDMFRQIDGSDSRLHGGVGLGLYIVRRILDELGGTVAVESDLGRGAAFTVCIPASLLAAEDGRASDTA